MNLDFSEYRFRAFEPWWSILRYVLVMAGLIWLAGRGAENLGYNWQWYRCLNGLEEIDSGRVVIDGIPGRQRQEPAVDSY
ncbi:MAG: hypothetical protein ACLFT5_06205 [Desulfovermiculus sp.]